MDVDGPPASAPPAAPFFSADALAAAKATALRTIADDDLPFENDLLRDPYSVRAWVRYLEHKLGAVTLGRAPRSHLALLYERAVRTLPGSYKLWKAYLDWSRTGLRSVADPHARDAEATRLHGCYARALLTLHKMPRLWTDYLGVLTKELPHRVGLIREAFDAALRALPTTQHPRVWDLYLPWAEGVGGPLAAHVHKRHLKLEPKQHYAYIKLLLDLGDYNGAATQLMRAISTSTDSGGKSSYDLFDKLCTVAVQHPDALTAVSVDDILRAGIRRFPQHAAPFWTALARYWLAAGRIERARNVFEEALRAVVTLRDFTQLFDAYLEVEEQVVAAHLETLGAAKKAAKRAKKAGDAAALAAATTARDAAQVDVDLRLTRLDRLMAARPVLVNDVLLRQNPHNVLEWIKRASLVPAHEVEQTYQRALATVHPKQATGGMDELWTAYAGYHETQRGDRDAARAVFEHAVKRTTEYKTVGELVNVWTAYADFELRAGNVAAARDLLGRACSIPAAGAATIDFRDTRVPAHRRLCKSLALWSYCVDLEECFGTRDTVVAAYDAMLALKIATPQVVVNYALYLEAHDYYEDAFKVYERGIDAFKWPVALDLWTVYLAKFMRRYALDVDVSAVLSGEELGEPAPQSGVHLERLRDLFEQAVADCPAQHARALYVPYAAVELQHGQVRRAMRVLDRACRAAPRDARRHLYAHAVHVATTHFGLVAARDVYERALPQLPDKAAAATCLEFAALELRLGEVDRARAVFAHGAALADPRGMPKYWTAWHAFEVQYGNEDTFKEMLRVKRSVQAQFNTEVNYIAAQLASAKQRHKDAAERAEKAKKDEEEKRLAFVPSGAGDGDGEEEDEGVTEVAQKQVPAAVFGKVAERAKAEAAKSAKQEEEEGAMARLAKKRKI
ncbi:pre-mRNA-splicing factor syf1 [Blastocladiella emersonii ATCC 22665]|nr:pre-mRNA-splicing factor syf1 [Blastocladiella emersonii ATCC 22665]